MISELSVLIWMCIVFFSLLLYIILDGSTLGIAMIFPYMKKYQRDQAMSIMLPTWDSSQTWLVFVLASSYGVFSKEFAYCFPQIYLQSICLAVGLLIRGVCFEFRLKSKEKMLLIWDNIFSKVSMLITLLHGYMYFFIFIKILGSNKMAMNFQYIFFMVILGISYLSMGFVRLLIKTKGTFYIRLKMLYRKFIKRITYLFFGILALNLYYNFLEIPDIFSLAFFVFIILGLFSSVYFLGSRDFFSYFIVMLCNTSFYCFIFFRLVFFKLLSMHSIGSGNSTLIFTLKIAIPMIPCIVVYTSYTYYVFRGKIDKIVTY